MQIRSLLLVLLLSLIIVAAMQNFANAEGAKKTKHTYSHIYFDKHFYNIGQKAVITIVDKNLNRHYDAIDSYKPVKGFISLEIDGRTVSDSFASKVFVSSFRETGPHTGIFKALLKIPSTDDMGNRIKGKEVRINYLDIQNEVVWYDTVTVL